MALKHGQQGRIILDADVDSITNTGIASVDKNGDERGSFHYKVTTPNDGCTTNNGFVILLKDVISWTKMSYKVTLTGTASCWNFNHNTNYLPAVAHNILGFNSSLDTVTKCTNTFEQSQFALKMFACDNNSDNFFHGSFAVGNPKIFTAVRRRDSISNGLAGPGIGVNCNATVTIQVSEIVVWE